MSVYWRHYVLYLLRKMKNESFNTFSFTLFSELFILFWQEGVVVLGFKRWSSQLQGRQSTT
jgi:hypothetical protein